ncbi:hypothetical protein K492DRAFT_185015 [Lichtheimia hyalospora FSU 10163]|nr:hypothetical protein K492DRAFT_185015 [Lichtheimia hyalospora FSU 10163]
MGYIVFAFTMVMIVNETMMSLCFLGTTKRYIKRSMYNLKHSYTKFVVSSMCKGEELRKPRREECATSNADPVANKQWRVFNAVIIVTTYALIGAYDKQPSFIHLY